MSSRQYQNQSPEPHNAQKDCISLKLEVGKMYFYKNEKWKAYQKKCIKDINDCKADGVHGASALGELIDGNSHKDIVGCWVIFS